MKTWTTSRKIKLNNTLKSSSDELPTEPMKDEPLVVHLKHGADIRPKAVTIMHPIPKHLRLDADELVKKLLRNSDIKLVPEDKISEWISPAFFVPEVGGVLLVTD